MANRKKDNPNKTQSQITNRLSTVEKQIVEIIKEQNKPTSTDYEVETIKQHKRLNKLTFAIVFVGVIQILVYCGLWYQAHRQNEISDSTNANTKQTIDLAENNSRIENRAWVGIESEPISSSQLSWTFSVGIKNFGKTPAESLCIGKQFCFSPLVRPSITMGSPASIAPQGTQNIYITPIGIGDSTNAKITDGRIKLYYYGIITYKDISGGIDTTEFMFLRGKPSDMDGSVEFKRIGINRMK